MRALKSLVVLYFLSIMVACGGAKKEEENKGTPTDRNISFELFPSSFLKDYSKTFDFNLVGAITVQGKKYYTLGSGAFKVTSRKSTKTKNDSYSVFYEYVMNYTSPKVTTLKRYSWSEYKVNKNGSELYLFKDTSLSNFYSSEYDDCGPYDNYFICNDDVSSEDSSSYAPKYAKIGDSGDFSKDRREKSSDGTTTTTTIFSKGKSWSLQDGYNGYALLVIKVKGLKGTWTEYWKINPSGERLGLKVVIEDQIGSATLTSK